MKHPIKYDVDLPKYLSTLRYDILAKFLSELAEEIKTDSVKDSERGRPLLASKLKESYGKLIESVELIRDAWEICKDKMKI